MPVLGIDLDAVVGDYEAAFRTVVAAELGVEPSGLPSQTDWNFTGWGIRDGAHFDELHRSGVLEHHMFATMPVIPGAAEALWRLSDAGYYIRIITHRLCVNFGHQSAVSDTVAWLDGPEDEHVTVDGITRMTRFPYRDLCFVGDKPQVGADLYLDDAPHNIAALRAAGAHAVVFDQAYNRHVDGPRVEDWEAAYRYITEHLPISEVA